MYKKIGRMTLDQITHIETLCKHTDCRDCLLSDHKPDLCNFLKDFKKFRKNYIARKGENVFGVKLNINATRLEEKI